MTISNLSIWEAEVEELGLDPVQCLDLPYRVLPLLHLLRQQVQELSAVQLGLAARLGHLLRSEQLEGLAVLDTDVVLLVLQVPADM